MDDILGCKNLKRYNEFQNEIISKYLRDHVPYDVKNKQELVSSFIFNNAWIVRYIYCKYLCEGREDCTLRDYI